MKKMYTDFFDLKKTIEDNIQTQEKILKSFESLIEVSSDQANQTPRECVTEIDKLKLYHYDSGRKTVHKTPTLIIYALVNTPSMMDIGQDRSFIKKLVDNNLDLYLIEWGFPTADDKYLSLDDYINYYIDECVDFIRKEKNVDKIN